MRDLSNFNIICIGDSVTKGVYLDGENIKKVNDNAINMVNQHFNCNIMNFSVFGQSLKRVYEKKLHLTTIDKYYDKNKNK